MAQTEAEAKLWVPCLVLAHVFAFIWLLRAFLLARTQRFIQRRGLSLGTASAYGGGPHLGPAQPEPQSNNSSASDSSAVDIEACCTTSDFNSAARDDHAARDDQTDESSGASSTSTPSTPVVRAMAVPQYSTAASKHDPKACAVLLDATAEPLTVEWQALGCSYNLDGINKVVLKDVWGKASPGQMQALMGPSGAGKSTLMDMLAMRKSVGNLSGRLLINGQPATASFIRRSSYVPQDTHLETEKHPGLKHRVNLTGPSLVTVMQENTFIPTMTTQETLAFYAGVTLGENWPRSKRKERVAAVLAAVGLADSTHTLVGGSLPGGLNLRGLSGGEKRRLAIAAGILAWPAVLYLDEPTSGLDSFAAMSVMGYLRNFAEATQQTVIATIHQPRSAIWEMFDTVSLLSSGRLMYHGPCSEMLPWFQNLGFSYNKGSESDWVLDLVATGFDKPDQLFGNTLRSAADVGAAADAFKEHYVKAHGCQPRALTDSCRSNSSRLSELRAQSNSSPKSFTSLVASGVAGSLWQSQSKVAYPTSWWRQFSALVSRELAGMTRNPFDVAARVLTFTYVALLFGLMGYGIPFEGVEGFRSRNNILFVTNLNTMLFPYISISLFTSDKRIYLADASAKRYRPGAYYVAKVVTTLPFSLVGTIAYSGILYGLSGLRPGAEHFAKYAVIVTLFYLIACQVLHLCAVIMPNQDATFALSIIWSTIQVLCSNFFISFGQVYNQWLTQLRYISAFYFAIEALMQNEMRGGVVDCSDGMNQDQVDMLTAGVANLSRMQKAVLNQLKAPQPGCIFHEDVLLTPMGFYRSYATSCGILVGYLAILHVLTFVGLLVAARRERR